MLLSAGICVLLMMVSCSATSALVRPQTADDPSHRESVNEGFSAEVRNKRALFAIGRALNVLLAGAKQLYSNGRDTVFIKHGGLLQATEDFALSNPRQVVVTHQGKTVQTLGQVGRNGVWKLILRRNEATKSTTLTVHSSLKMINRYNGDKIIVYTE